ncbi:hypothetical protein [Carboxylicivirga taeanensis]|uniref:hypothetical protein n=1 Tax=Carboxylicivirga taeanensis TaxID=1416875 RepID=UPI003F6E38E5
MNKLTSILCLASLCFCGSLFSQTIDYSGPVAASMGFVKVFDDSPWASLNNVSNLATHKGLAVGASYQMRFNMKGLSSRAATIIVPGSFGTISGLVYQSGYEKSNYSRYAMSFSRQFGEKVSAGLQFNYLAHQIQGDDRADGLYSSLGLNFVISQQWGMGVYIQNPEQGKINYQETTYAVPTLFNAALRWRPFIDFQLMIELEKNLDADMIYKSGLQFNFKHKLFVRGGIKGKPVEMTFGGGIRLAGLSIDVGFAHHQQLGITSGAGLSYLFNRKNR